MDISMNIHIQFNLTESVYSCLRDEGIINSFALNILRCSEIYTHTHIFTQNCYAQFEKRISHGDFLCSSLHLTVYIHIYSNLIGSKPLFECANDFVSASKYFKHILSRQFGCCGYLHSRIYIRDEWIRCTASNKLFCNNYNAFVSHIRKHWAWSR